MLCIAEPADACMVAQRSIVCPRAALLSSRPSSKQQLFLQQLLPEDADRRHQHTRLAARVAPPGDGFRLSSAFLMRLL